MELNVSYGRGSGHVNFYGEAAFDQLKAHDTISERWAEDDYDETSAVPYHAVDYAYVYRGYMPRPVRDENCNEKCGFNIFVDGSTTPIFVTEGMSIPVSESFTVWSERDEEHGGYYPSVNFRDPDLPESVAYPSDYEDRVVWSIYWNVQVSGGYDRIRFQAMSSFDCPYFYFYVTKPSN